MAFHVTVVRAGRWPLFGSPSAVLAGVRATCRCVGQRLMLFCIADDHMHLVIEGARHEVSRLAANMQLVLGRSFRPPDAKGRLTQRAHLEPVEDRRHLENLVRYLIVQPTRHGCSDSNVTWPGSCFADLVGARIVAGFDRRALARALPRLREQDVWDAAGLRAVEPIPIDALPSFAPLEIVRAASAVYAVPQLGEGRRPEVVAARSLGLALLGRAGIASTQAARLVGCSERLALVRRRTDPDPDAISAALLQLAIQRHVTGARSAASGPPRRGRG